MNCRFDLVLADIREMQIEAANDLADKISDAEFALEMAEEELRGAELDKDRRAWTVDELDAYRDAEAAVKARSYELDKLRRLA